MERDLEIGGFPSALKALRNTDAATSPGADFARSHA